jgi:hypothetical protein
MKVARGLRRDLFYGRQRAESLRFDGEDGIKLAAEVFQRDDRRQLEKWRLSRLKKRSVTRLPV